MSAVDLLICDGCGCTTTDAELSAMRENRSSLISCCPERKMRPATREDWDGLRKEKAACICDVEDFAPVSAGKVKAQADGVRSASGAGARWGED